MAAGNSLHAYISQFYTRKGDGPVQEGDARQLRRLSMASPASSADWTVEPDQRVPTPAGTFSCERRSFVASEARDIPSGRVTLKQKRSDRVVVFTAPSVPLFHLVRSEIERTRESHTVPPVRGIPEAGPKTSRTTSLLTIVAALPVRRRRRKKDCHRTASTRPTRKSERSRAASDIILIRQTLIRRKNCHRSLLQNRNLQNRKMPAKILSPPRKNCRLRKQPSRPPPEWCRAMTMQASEL